MFRFFRFLSPALSTARQKINFPPNTFILSMKYKASRTSITRNFSTFSALKSDDMSTQDAKLPSGPNGHKNTDDSAKAKYPVVCKNSFGDIVFITRFTLAFPPAGYVFTPSYDASTTQSCRKLGGKDLLSISLGVRNSLLHK